MPTASLMLLYFYSYFNPSWIDINTILFFLVK